MIRRLGLVGVVLGIALLLLAVMWAAPVGAAPPPQAGSATPTATPDLPVWLDYLLRVQIHCEEFPGYFDDRDTYHIGLDCVFVYGDVLPTPTPTSTPPTTAVPPTQEVTEFPTATPSSSPMPTMATPAPTGTPTPTPTPNPDQFAVLRVVSPPDKNVRALCSLNGGIIGTWPVGVARPVFSFAESDGFIWANQAYGNTVLCSAIGYRGSSGPVWWVRLLSGDLLSLPGWPKDLDTNEELPSMDRSFDTTQVGVALHVLQGADQEAIYRNANKWAGTVTLDLSWGVGAWVKALNPHAENICRTTRWGDVPDISNLDGWYWQQINTMPSLESRVCDVYQIGNEYSQWFTMDQWANMNIRFIELAEAEGRGRRLGLGATGPGHLPVEAKDEVPFRRLLERLIKSPIAHVLILHQSGYCDAPECTSLPYVNDPWVAGSDDRAFNDLLHGQYNNLVDVRVGELGLGDGYAGGSGGPSDCTVVAQAMALTVQKLSEPHRQVRWFAIWNFGGAEMGWKDYSYCADEIAAAL